MQYRTDVTELNDQILKNAALSAEQESYMAHTEVARLRETKKAVPAAEKASVQTAIEEAQARYKDAKRRAGRKAARAPLSAEDKAGVARPFLENWIAGIEREHVAHTSQKAEREAAIAVTGANAMTADEKKAARDRIKENEKALKVLEAAHKVAIAKIEALEAGVADPTLEAGDLG